MVTLFSKVYSPQDPQPSSFFLTMWRGEDQGEEDLLMIPAFSMAENSALAEVNFSGQGDKVWHKLEDLEL